MRNKILVIDSDAKVQITFEKALEKFVAEGGELFLADKLQTGVEVAEKEHPQLVFVSTQINDFDQKLLESLSSSVILISKEELIKNRFPTLTKPLKSSAILDRCKKVFTNHPAADFPPL